MFLRNLFKPKWQHSNPEVRRSALLALDPSDNAARDILGEIARNDAIAELRQLAVKRLSDPTLVAQIAENDADPAVRNTAQKQYMHLLAGTDEHAPDIGQRLALVKEEQDSKTLEYVAQKGTDKALRLAALARVNRESVLSGIACDDPDAEVRLAALEKVEDKGALERVYNATRTRDKQVSRLAREKVEALIAAEELPGRVRHQRRKICIALEALLKNGAWERAEEELERLDTEWRSLELPAEPDLAQRFDEARGRADKALAAYKEQERKRQDEERKLAPLREAKESICGTLEGLLADLQARDTLPGRDLNLVDSALALHENAWQTTGRLPEDEERDYQARYTRLRTAVKDRRDALLGLGEALQSLESLNKKAEQLLEVSTPDEKAVERLAARWEALEKPQGEQAEELSTRLEKALSTLRSRVGELRQARDAQIENLKTALRETETALDAGELAGAEQAQRDAQKAANALGEAVPNKLRQRLQKANGRANELKKWRDWAATPKKEQLITQVEALIGADAHPKEIAAKVQEAREAWKALGPADPSKAKALWERFNEACTKAYEPATAYFAEEGERRKANQAAREAFLGRLETFIAEANWDEVDWKKVERLERDARKEWRDFGPTDRRSAKILSERFKTVMDDLRQRLEGEWARNVPKREALIREVEEFAQLEDVREAVEQTKRAQKTWQETGRVSPKQERALWKRFRAACDEVFARRQAAYDEQREHLRAISQTKRAIIEELEGLAKLEGEALTQAEGRIRQLEADFRAAGTGEKNQDTQLEGRLRQAQRRFRAARSAADKARVQAQLELLKQKSALCGALEAIVEIGTAEKGQTADDLARQWAALATLPEDLEDVIGRRFERARAALEDEQVRAEMAREREQNLAVKETLCIRMEILAGVESPPEAQQARMAYQVARLSEEMGQGGGGKGKEQERREIEREWVLVGPVPAARIDALEKRFQKARGAVAPEESKVLAETD